MAGKNWNNIDDTAIPLNWAEMSGEKDVDSTIGGKTGENAIRVTGNFVELLNQSVDSEDKYAIRGTFAKVTTEENDQDVDGKYSFPGNRMSREGENYPFPTILTENQAWNQRKCSLRCMAVGGYFLARKPRDHGYFRRHGFGAYR